LHCVKRSDGIIVDDKLDEIWKGMGVVSFNVLKHKCHPYNAYISALMLLREIISLYCKNNKCKVVPPLN
jgi:hypothetical protein